MLALCIPDSLWRKFRRDVKMQADTDFQVYTSTNNPATPPQGTTKDPSRPPPTVPTKPLNEPKPDDSPPSACSGQTCLDTMPVNDPDSLWRPRRDGEAQPNTNAQVYTATNNPATPPQGTTKDPSRSPPTVPTKPLNEAEQYGSSVQTCPDTMPVNDPDSLWRPRRDGEAQPDTNAQVYTATNNPATLPQGTTTDPSRFPSTGPTKPLNEAEQYCSSVQTCPDTMPVNGPDSLWRPRRDGEAQPDTNAQVYTATNNPATLPQGTTTDPSRFPSTGPTKLLNEAEQYGSSVQTCPDTMPVNNPDSLWRPRRDGEAQPDTNAQVYTATNNPATLPQGTTTDPSRFPSTGPTKPLNEAEQYGSSVQTCPDAMTVNDPDSLWRPRRDGEAQPNTNAQVYTATNNPATPPQGTTTDPSRFHPTVPTKPLNEAEQYGSSVQTCPDTMTVNNPDSLWRPRRDGEAQPNTNAQVYTATNNPATPPQGTTTDPSRLHPTVPTKPLSEAGQYGSSVQTCPDTMPVNGPNSLWRPRRDGEAQPNTNAQVYTATNNPATPPQGTTTDPSRLHPTVPTKPLNEPKPDDSPPSVCSVQTYPDAMTVNDLLMEARKLTLADLKRVAELHNDGVRLRDEGNYKRALRYLRLALYKCNSFPRDALKIYEALGLDYSTLLERCELFLEEYPNYKTTIQITILCNLGDAYNSSGRIRKALYTYQEALTMQRGLHKGEDHTEVANALNNVGHTCDRLGKYDQALNYYQQALTMQRALHKGADHAEVANALGCVGNALFNLGKHQEALEHYQKDLKIHQALHEGKNHADVARALNHVGHACDRLGEAKQALECFKKAFEICQKLPRDDPNTALTTKNAAKWYCKVLSKLLGAYKENANRLQGIAAFLHEMEIVRTLRDMHHAYAQKNQTQQQHQCTELIQKVAQILQTQNQGLSCKITPRSTVVVLKPLGGGTPGFLDTPISIVCYSPTGPLAGSPDSNTSSSSKICLASEQPPQGSPHRDHLSTPPCSQDEEEEDEDIQDSSSQPPSGPVIQNTEGLQEIAATLHETGMTHETAHNSHH